MSEAIDYRITPVDPGGHVFAVRLTVPGPNPDGQRLTLPAWIPGSYLVRDFARHIVELSAASNGQPVKIDKIDKSTWVAEPADGPLVVDYRVYAYDRSVRGAYLDFKRGFFNGVCVFLCVDGQHDSPCRVRIDQPVSKHCANWKLATTLRSIDAPPMGFGQFSAPNYDELIDHPVEMCDFSVGRFSAAGVPHEIVISGQHRANMGRLERDLKALCEYHIGFFGEAPMERYLFLTLATGDGYGGLEHRDSTSLICARDDLPVDDDGPVDEAYRRFLGLCSHEYFHLWNIKRMKPASFVPYALDRESYTKLLWIFEGITSYYDDLALLKSGLITEESYLDLVARNITRIWRTPGRHRQSIAESSFDAWIKHYKPNENSANATISYYSKGALVGLLLDLTIRKATGGKHALDDVMRAMWTAHGRTGTGLPEGGFEELIRKVTGLDLAGAISEMVYGTDDPPLEDLLASAGIDVGWYASGCKPDAGDKKPPESQSIRASLGLRVNREGLPRVLHVADGGAAHAAGISGHDELVALDGIRVSVGNLDRLLENYEPGERVTVHAFRNDELMRFSVELRAPEKDTCYLARSENADESAKELRAAWLGGG